MDTNTPEYANYLISRQKSIRTVIVQLPYQTHLRLLNLGRTLEIGCGAGRNLKTLNRNSVGIDHNPLLVKACREIGLNSFTTEDWLLKGPLEFGKFDSILLAHVAEHMNYPDFVSMLKKYSPYVRMGGKVVVICPQERGYETDATHLEFMDFYKIRSALRSAATGEQYSHSIKASYSFPFPRFIGKFFPYNEFVVVATKDTAK